VPGTAGDDPRFEDRVRAARSIWRVKVATVSREGSLGNNRRYEVTLRVLENLSGAPPPAQVTLTISGKDPSFHWLDRVGGAWVGRELLLLSREYRNAPREDRAVGDGASASEHVLHFHGEPDTPELRERVRSIQAAMRAAERAAQTPKK